MQFKTLSGLLLLLTILVTAAACSFPDMDPAYEVWAVDQSALLATGLVDSYTYGTGKIFF